MHMPFRSLGCDLAKVIVTLKARIEVLQAELAKLEAVLPLIRGPSVNVTGRSLWSLSCWRGARLRPQAASGMPRRLLPLVKGAS